MASSLGLNIDVEVNLVCLSRKVVEIGLQWLSEGQKIF
jgi:hypothetical protein